jgi:hypothetical protein
MSRIILVFLSNKIANVGSRYVELLRLLTSFCYTLGVDYTHDVLTGVLCVVICVTVPGVEGTSHLLIHGV